jgi:PAS domain S-box-containing protein
MPRAPPPMIETALSSGAEAPADMPLSKPRAQPVVTGPMSGDASRASRFALGTGMVAIAYAAGLRITGELLSGPELTAALYVPGALLFAAFLATPPLYWSAIVGSALVAHWVTYAAAGAPSSAIALSFVPIAVCAFVSAMLCRRYIDLSAGLGTVRAMSRFMLIALITPFICGVLPAILVGIDRLPDVLAPPDVDVAAGDRMAWIIATLGYSLAYVTVVPAALAGYDAFRNTLADAKHLVAPWPRLIEGIGLSIAVAVASTTALAAPAFPFAGALALIAPLPLVFYVVLRFRLAGAAWALLIVAVAALHGGVSGAGALLLSSAEPRIFALQVVFLALGAPLLLLGASIDEALRANRLAQQGAEQYALAARAGRVFKGSYLPDSGTLDADPQLGNLLGLGSHEVGHADWWWEHLHPDDIAMLRRRLATPGTTGALDAGAGPVDFRMIGSDGSIRWFRLQLSAPRSPNGETRYAATIVDITELKMAQLASEQRSRELAHVARAATVGELAAALAHEIRQPLTAILINSQTAVRVIDAQPQQQQIMALREIMEQVAADGRRAGDVIQRIRAFAKKGELQRGLIDLNAMVREAVQIVRHDTIRRRVEIKFALTPELLTVYGDRVQLQQVALNLVLNALEAVADRPPDVARLVTIESRRATSHTALLTVRDTGPGVPAERQEAIFAPFVTSKPNGLGMGLAISRTIVEAHGGVIWCESDPAAGGAAFIVALPLGVVPRQP